MEIYFIMGYQSIRKYKFSQKNLFLNILLEFCVKYPKQYIISDLRALFM